MRRTMTIMPIAVLAVLMTAAVWLPPVEAGSELLRLAADPRYHGPFEEKFTALEPPGTVIYDKTVFVPRNANVLYLTMSTTGDAHGGAASCFTALVDGVFFNAGGQGAARCALGGTQSVPGWVTLLKVPDAASANCNDGGGGGGDCHDNSIKYEWCTPIKRGPHRVEVRMATDTAGQNVFIEQAFFYVDASRIKSGSACGATARPPRDDDDDDD